MILFGFLMGTLELWPFTRSAVTRRSFNRIDANVSLSGCSCGQVSRLQFVPIDRIHWNLSSVFSCFITLACSHESKTIKDTGQLKALSIWIEVKSTWSFLRQTGTRMRVVCVSVITRLGDCYCSYDPVLCMKLCCVMQLYFCSVFERW